MTESETLWTPGSSPDAQMLHYTVADDRQVDQRILRWDLLGSLGHLEALRFGKIISTKEYRELRQALLAALNAYEAGNLVIGEEHEDGHSAVEFWLTRHFGDAGQRLHTGRSRNDQVAVDLRLFLKDQTLSLHRMMLELAAVLFRFAAANRKALWPGYTHQRIAMPSSAAIWAGGFGEGVLDSAESIKGFWDRLDRSPLGSAAGYGVPLPLAREKAAAALGFSGVDQIVTTTQNSRGKLEAAVLFWCLDAAHECSKLASDVILFSSEEFGWIQLPAELSTGSSIMPQKRNPDLFELTRARESLLQGDLATLLALKGHLLSGYHRDFQFLKTPLFRGLDRTREMLGMLTTAIPRLRVNAGRGLTRLTGEVLATDEVMRRVRKGVPFRQAYREVSAVVKRNEPLPAIDPVMLSGARSAIGNIGNPGIDLLQRRSREQVRWNSARRRGFDRALTRLTRPGKP